MAAGRLGARADRALPVARLAHGLEQLPGQRGPRRTRRARPFESRAPTPLRPRARRRALGRPARDPAEGRRFLAALSPLRAVRTPVRALLRRSRCTGRLHRAFSHWYCSSCARYPLTVDLIWHSFFDFFLSFNCYCLI